MPELPEVEAARRAISESCIGKKIIKAVIADDTKVIDGVSPQDFEKSLTGKKIVGVFRKGKNMWMELDSPPFPSFQFGMAGAIYIKGVAVTKYKRSAVSDTDEWPSKYSKLFIELDDGLELSFTDKRRFAKVRLLKNPASAPPISELGPDALLEPMTEDELFKALSKKKIGIKALLLDQVLAIGSQMKCYIRQESILNKVLPAFPKKGVQHCITLSKRLFGIQLKLMLTSPAFLVIENAVEVGADSSQFPSNWIYHSREKKPGKAFVDGKKIDFITAGGRTTAYVPELQKLTGDQAGKEVVKPQKRSGKKSKDEADESESEDDKPKGRKKTTQNKAKKAPAKRKSKDDDEGDDVTGDEVMQEDKKPATRKRTPARKKSQESDDDSDSDEEVDVKEKQEEVKNVQTARQSKRAK
ncbi:formamidopyrimidine-DNA glycosylase isoform X1 [Tanacetum coccineum]